MRYHSHNVLLPDSSDPVVVYIHHSLSDYAWIFSLSTFNDTRYPWLALHRQSLNDDDLDHFLVDSAHLQADAVECFLRELYRDMRLDPQDIDDCLFDDAQPIRQAVKAGDIKVYGYPISPTDSPSIFTAEHIVWSHRDRHHYYDTDSLDYSRHTIAYQLGSALQPRWARYAAYNRTYYAENLLMRRLIDVGALFTGVIDGVSSLVTLLWDIGKCVVTVVGKSLSATIECVTDPPNLDEIINGLNALGIPIGKGYDQLKQFFSDVVQFFNAILSDVMVGYAVYCYLDGLIESMTWTIEAR